MASKHPEPEQQNFFKLSLACVDEARALLGDILRSQIPPKDLFIKIQTSTTLLSGSRHEKLNPEQLKLCYIPGPVVPDYQCFDVTLLYKLIRNLCSTLPISQGWGSKPNSSDMKIGDDIERLRIIRNEMFGHAESSSVPDDVFNSKWKELENIFKRIQVFLTSMGNTKRLLERLEFIKETDFGWQDYTRSELHMMFERMKLSDAPKLSLQGNEQKVCGESACFQISFGDDNISYNWPITWKRIRGNTTEQLDISTEKYRGSSSQQLIIGRLSKEDEGVYRANVLREENGIHKEIPSNSIYLTVTGDLPICKIESAISEEDRITIHYSVSVGDKSPAVHSIMWTKDGECLETNTDKYSGGQLMDTTFTIHSPTSVDIGQYTCEVFNAVGSVKKHIPLNVPFVSIVEDLIITVGNPINIEATIQSYPTQVSATWQKSDRLNFDNFAIIDMHDAKYFGSQDDPKKPRLVIPRTRLEDAKYYRLVVFNRIGQGISNPTCLKLVGDVPSLSVNHETNNHERSVMLVCEITVPDDSPEVSDIFWTKDNRKIDIAGSGGKYTGGSIAKPSLTIKAVNANDRGIYQCCASNSVGDMRSEKIPLAPPSIEFDNPDLHELQESVIYNATIKAIPIALNAHWLSKQDGNDDFQTIDIHQPLYRGSTVGLPRPRLVVNNCKTEQMKLYQLEVFNFIGSNRQSTPDIVLESFDANINQEIESSDANINQEISDPLKNFYSKRGCNVRFANLSDDLAESLPEKSLGRLKDVLVLIGVNDLDAESIKQVTSVRGLVMLLQDRKLFTKTDVIFMQYLLKKAGCKELYEKCIQYAREQKALCFFEKQPDNGFKHVKFHIEGKCENYLPKDIEDIRETVANLLGCTTDDVLTDGICPANSFFVVLAIKEMFIGKISHIDQRYMKKLSDLKVDYFILHGEKYHTGKHVEELSPVEKNTLKPLSRSLSTKYMETDVIKERAVILPAIKSHQYLTEETEFDITSEDELESIERKYGDFVLVKKYDKERRMFKIMCRLLPDYYPERRMHQRMILDDHAARKIIRRDSVKAEKAPRLPPGSGSTKRKEEKCEDDENLPRGSLRDVLLSHKVYSPAKDISIITIPNVRGVNHISVVTSDRLWVCDDRGLLQVDSSGRVLHEKLRFGYGFAGYHTVTEAGNLLFIDDNGDVRKITSDGTAAILLTTNRRAYCIHSSRINGDILVGSHRGVMRYDGTGRELKVIKKDDNTLYGIPMYITENKNGDILVSDRHKHAVVVVDKSGRHRFNYTGRLLSFSPRGICTDILGHILVCDPSNGNVNLLDQDGQFLSLLLTTGQHEIFYPTALCVDDQHNLYMGEELSTKIHVYKYLQDTDRK